MAKSKIDEIREDAEADLATFIRLLAPHIHLGQVHYDLIEWLTRSESLDNQLVLLPRGHMKSKVAAFITAWWLTRNPDETILYVSATAALAEEQLYAIKGILESPIYRRYWPTMIHPDEGKREKWAVAEIKVDHPKRKSEAIRDPSIKAVGLTGNIAGFHASIVVLDDVVVPGNAYTQDGRDKVAALYSQLASIENPGARELVVGTRYHPVDLYNTLIEMREVVIPDEGEIDEDIEAPVYELYQKVVETNGEYLWPRSKRTDGKAFGFDAKTLARIKAKYVDFAQFYAQYYNNPNDKGDASIEKDKFQYYERSLLTQEDDYWFFNGLKLNIYAAIDFAFSLSKKADYSSIVVIGVDYKNNYYVLDIDRFKTNKISKYFDQIVQAQNKWGFSKMRAEVTVGQAAIVKELKTSYFKPNGTPISIDEYRPTRHDGAKEERMTAILEPKYDNMQIWHYKGGNCEILEQELILRRPPHDDVKESLANAIAISKPPTRQASHLGQPNTIIYHKRFGGCR